jgi:hypothetical protein
MSLLPALQAVDTTNPVVIVVALVVGLIAFLIFRTLFRALNFVFHLGCLAIVALAAFFILRGVIK